VTRAPLLWLGLGGVAPDDNARARQWGERLQWVMVVIALLAIPAYFLDSTDDRPDWHRFAQALDAAIFVAFLAETVWMAHVSSFPRRYLVENWLNFVIVAASLASLLGASAEWVPLARILRGILGGLVVMKVGADASILFTRRGAPLLSAIAAGTVLAAGGLFFWLDPAIHSFWEGAWLTFVTATTIGYGDLVPSTGASRVVAVFVSVIGAIVLALFTANVVAIFIGREDAAERRELREELVALRRAIDELRAVGDGMSQGAGGSPTRERDDQDPLVAALRDLREEVARLSERVDGGGAPGSPRGR
jgi:voltage-gated potassium channel